MYPDFLLIGAQRAGSSWLSLQLRRHPQILLPPIKELHYFDREISGSMFWNDIFSEKRSDLMVKFRMAAVNMLRQRSHGISWPLRYFWGKRSDEWYARLFPSVHGVVQGDCTPAYSILDEQTVSHIAKIMPETNILFILRDPVERSWSHAKLDLGRRSGRSLEDVSDEEYIEHSMQKASLLRSDYCRTIDTWSKFYPAEQIKVGFFDDMKRNPNAYLDDIFTFLGVDSVSTNLAESKKKAVNATGSYPMPAKVRKHLSRYYLHDLAALSERYGGHATEWHKKAMAVVDGEI